LIKRNEQKKNQVRLKALTCGHRSKKQAIARSRNASLFFHYAAKRTNKNTVKKRSERARGLYAMVRTRFEPKPLEKLHRTKTFVTEKACKEILIKS
jgi:hypothetical protein